MEEFKRTVANNITFFRQELGLTQAELGEKLNYSDKTVSKWERAESVPDAYVLKQLAALFGVTVDDLLSPYEPPAPEDTAAKEEGAVPVASYSTAMITAVAIVSIWTVALLIFVILWMNEIIFPLLFVAALPISLVTLLVLRSLWNHGRYNYWIVSALVLSVFLLLYYCFWHIQPWQLLLVVVPGELIVWLCFHIKRR